jgi:hypothetical protein
MTIIKYTISFNLLHHVIFPHAHASQTLSSKVMAVEMLQNHGTYSFQHSGNKADLSNSGIGAADIAKLRAAKLNTVGVC